MWLAPKTLIKPKSRANPLLVQLRSAKTLEVVIKLAARWIKWNNFLK